VSPMPPTPRPARSPKPTRSASRSKEKPASKPVKDKEPTVADVVAAREAELSTARNALGLAKTPAKMCSLFLGATKAFLMEQGLVLARSRVALMLVYPIAAAWLATQTFFPEWYAPPDCLGGPAGFLYPLQLASYDFAWWLVLGILSSIGLGTGLHSGLMFLWPFVLNVVTTANEDCQSTAFSATYNHPCCLKCPEVGSSTKNDGTLTFLNTFILLAPAVITWGCGTAIGELPPYFITRAARRAGKRATDFEEELAEARRNSDIVSVLKVWTIDFTERHGFVGILLLASWPNAAFDMCGMACGWLEVPFWTFFGATLLGKGVIKVTLQTCVCIAVFGPKLWSLLLSVVPAVSWPVFFCKNAGAHGGSACTLHSFLVAGRHKMMYKFSLQRRMVPAELLGTQAYLTERHLLDKYCGVMTACGEQSYSGGWSNTERQKEMAAVAKRVIGALDVDADGRLTHNEVSAAVGASDGKLSLGSLDPGEGGLLSMGNLWNLFIVSLILFFVYSIVEQVALNAQKELDAADLESLQERLNSAKAEKKKRK